MKNVKCTCGAHKTSQPFHSEWCDYSKSVYDPPATIISNIEDMYNESVFVDNCPTSIVVDKEGKVNLSKESINEIAAAVRNISLGGGDKKKLVMYVIGPQSTLTPEHGVTIVNPYGFSIKVDIYRL